MLASFGTDASKRHLWDSNTRRGDHIGLAGRRLRHSAKVSMCGEGAEQALGLSVVGRAAGSKKHSNILDSLGIETRTSRTLSENHATRPNSQ